MCVREKDSVAGLWTAPVSGRFAIPGTPPDGRTTCVYVECCHMDLIWTLRQQGQSSGPCENVNSHRWQALPCLFNRACVCEVPSAAVPRTYLPPQKPLLHVSCCSSSQASPSSSGLQLLLLLLRMSSCRQSTVMPEHASAAARVAVQTGRQHSHQSAQGACVGSVNEYRCPPTALPALSHSYLVWVIARACMCVCRSSTQQITTHKQHD